jgi:sugar phosphate permease
MSRQRWVVLTSGLVAVTTGCSVQYGASFLIPELRVEGLDLAQAGALAGAPIGGLLATLYLWGAAADRWGERRVMSTGLTIGGAALLTWVAAFAPSGPGLASGGSVAVASGSGLHALPLAAALALAGAGTAAVHAASGRLVLGWFAPHERGRAMAVRQTAQPLGVAIAALALPPLANIGLPAAIGTLGAACLVAAAVTVALVRDPPARTAAAGSAEGPSPYRTAMLWRIHAASSLLVIPQFLMATYALVYLVDAQHWASVPAGRLIAAAQFGGAVNRLVVGWWSDRAGSRLGPMRRLAVGIAAVLGVLSLATLSGSSLLAVTALVAATVLSSSTNGLAFTAVAERAGSAWAGRALGVQNTAQNAFAAATPAAFGAVIGAVGYASTFGLALALPLAACVLVPVRSEQRARVQVP